MLDGCLVESLFQLFSKFSLHVVSKKLLEHSSIAKSLWFVMFLSLGLPNNFFRDPVWWDCFWISPKSLPWEILITTGKCMDNGIGTEFKILDPFLFLGGSTLYSTLFVGSWTYSGAYVGRCAFLQCPFSGAFGGCIPKQFPVKGRDGAVLKILAWGYGLNLVEKW